VTVLFVVVGIAVVVALAMLAVGRLGELPESTPDRAPLDVPDAPLAPDDVEAVRFAVGLRGYRMDEVDEVLDKVAADLGARDARIAELESRLAGAASAPVVLAEPLAPQWPSAAADGPPPRGGRPPPEPDPADR
jgi:DivIVA domain-containing protein